MRHTFGIIGHMNTQYLLGLFVAVLVIGGLFLYTSRAPSAPVSPAEHSTSTPTLTPPNQPASTSTTPAQPKSTGPFTITLARGDTVASWNFQGAYTDNPDLLQKAQVEIARLSSMLGSGTYTDYELYVSIASQYDLLGEGAKELTYLEKALGIDSAHTGLAWENTGGLMTRLGANLTARTAFENAVDAQPSPQYIQTLISFLQTNFPQDSADIQKAQKLLQTEQGTTTSQ